MKNQTVSSAHAAERKERAAFGHRSWRIAHTAAIAIAISGCAAIGVNQYNALYGEAEPQARIAIPTSAAGDQYTRHVKPIIESRCVSCHACYDAPCQLKLTTPQGIDRGISEKPVYSSSRLFAAEPTRLFVDHDSVDEWREDGFMPVLNERRQTPEFNKVAGLLYQSVWLKQRHPLPDGELLSTDAFDFSLNRKNSCPSVETYDAYSQRNPLAGMPYGLPGLNNAEFRVLDEWVAKGGIMADEAPLSPVYHEKVREWEAFLNQDSLKGQLVSRYLYEHLFLANLYFESLDGQSERATYFKLVRSATPPGNTIAVIGARRPINDPKVERVYYRLQRMASSLVTKTHLPYPLSDARMKWLTELFFEADYEVTDLPGYEHDYINPFITYRSIPAQARYRFMLEDAKFIIEGFIKGPVCRGQVAVDVINDHFWVFFVNPDTEAIPMLDGFIEQQSANLRLPGEDGSNAGFLRHWKKYSKLNSDYLMAKRDALNVIFDGTMSLNVDLIWDGDGHNPNAALTVFRNFDNAAVVQGLVGSSPKTAWIIDYPLLERIHYLLTVDFDVYGSLGHQLNTRLYMDFLRIEGEFNFLALMPPSQRLTLRDYWYRDASLKVREHLYSCESYLEQTPSISYVSNDPKNELYQILEQKLAPALNNSFSLRSPRVPPAQRNALTDLESVKGIPASLMAEMTVLLVEDEHGEGTVYTIVGNKAHSNITSLFREIKNRLPEEDTLTVAYGVIGDYPNAFLRINESDLRELTRMIGGLRNEQDYRVLMSRFGVRRTNSGFWQHSDRVHALYRKQSPSLAGWMDYNRIENR